MLRLSELVFLFATCVVAQDETLPCFPLEPRTDNAQLAATMRRMFEQIIARMRQPQPELKLPVLEPYYMAQGGPYQVNGPQNTQFTIELFNTTFEGYSTSAISQLEVTGSGNSRTIRITSNVQRISSPSGQYRLTSPTQMQGDFSGSVTNVQGSTTIRLTIGQRSEIDLAIQLVGEIQATVNPDPNIPEEIQREIGSMIFQEEGLRLLRLFIGNVRETCPSV